MGAMLYNVNVQYLEFLQRVVTIQGRYRYHLQRFLRDIHLHSDPEVKFHGHLFPQDLQFLQVHHLMDEKLFTACVGNYTERTVFRAAFHNRNECFKAFYTWFGQEVEFFNIWERNINQFDFIFLGFST